MRGIVYATYIRTVKIQTRGEEEEENSLGRKAEGDRLTSQEEGQQERYDDSHARNRHALLLGKAPVPFRVGCEVTKGAATVVAE